MSKLNLTLLLSYLHSCKSEWHEVEADKYIEREREKEKTVIQVQQWQEQ